MKLAEIQRAIQAGGIEDDQIERFPAGAGRHGAIEERQNVLLARRIGRHGFSAVSHRADGFACARDLVLRSTGGENVVAFRSEAPANGGADPAFGAHSNDDRTRCSHALVLAEGRR